MATTRQISAPRSITGQKCATNRPMPARPGIVNPTGVAGFPTGFSANACLGAVSQRPGLLGWALRRSAHHDDRRSHNNHRCADHDRRRCVPPQVSRATRTAGSSCLPLGGALRQAKNATGMVNEVIQRTVHCGVFPLRYDLPSFCSAPALPPRRTGDRRSRACRRRARFGRRAGGNAGRAGASPATESDKTSFLFVQTFGAGEILQGG